MTNMFGSTASTIGAIPISPAAATASTIISSPASAMYPCRTSLRTLWTRITIVSAINRPYSYVGTGKDVSAQ